MRAPRALAPLLACTLAGALPARLAGADGGTVRLVEPVGAFVVTVFSTPEPLRVGATDLSVLLQDRVSGVPLLDARVALEVLPPAGGDATPLRLAATHADATNKLLYAARFTADRAGDWTVHVTVRRGTDSIAAQCLLPVAPGASGLSAIWPYLALPPVAVALYALHARLLRRQRSRHGVPSRDARTSQ